MMRKDKILYLLNEYNVKYSTDSYRVDIKYEYGDFVFYLNNSMTGETCYEKLTPVYDIKTTRKLKLEEICK